MIFFFFCLFLCRSLLSLVAISGNATEIATNAITTTTQRTGGPAVVKSINLINGTSANFVNMTNPDLTGKF